MIIFENDGEIDIRLATMIGVNVKENANAIGFFGTGLKYAIACLSRWGESIVIQSGEHEYSFGLEQVEIRGKEFGLLTMSSRYDRLQLGFTTELGKQWEPWMVYRELWCNAQDETEPRIYEADDAPRGRADTTRILVAGEKIEQAHATKAEFILEGREPLLKTKGLEIYEGEGRRIFYRGIAVQTLEKTGIYTYNITDQLYLTEDRTAGSWQTNSIIARGLSLIADRGVISATIAAPAERMESQLDYCNAATPSEEWRDVAGRIVRERPLDIPTSVRSKFVEQVVEVCPTCGRPVSADDQIPF